jgi:drug/metabolite transporter (DMT)-like permease
MAYLGLLFNALVWGLSWWPLRELQAQGLHPVWATGCFFLVGLSVLLVSRREALGMVLSQPWLWALALAAGSTNAAFNWAVSIGDVVRVVLLFYLMPLWAVLLARVLLGEPVSPGSLARIALALVGAALVLRPAEGGWPSFHGLSDVLGVLGGFGFALNNVILRKQAHVPSSARALAMFMGGLVLPAGLGLVLSLQGSIPGWPAPAWGWVLGAAAMGLLFFASNMALQVGASQLPVAVTSVIMLTEVVFATGSSVLAGEAQLTALTLTGGAMILAASLMSALAEANEGSHLPDEGELQALTRD